MRRATRCISSIPVSTAPDTTRPDGSKVRKFDAPKATLVSYIIKGILDRQLPWALVLFGVVIALVLEMSGVSSLPFAVGVYLPLSSSAPIFIGGMVRWLVDARRRRHAEFAALSDEEHIAESDLRPVCCSLLATLPVARWPGLRLRSVRAG